VGDAAPLRDRDGALQLLAGRVEVDETFLGGEQPGVPGRGALGKTLVVVAVELHEPAAMGGPG